jgi:hypothetical protein
MYTTHKLQMKKNTTFSVDEKSIDGPNNTA